MAAIKTETKREVSDLIVHERPNGDLWLFRRGAPPAFKMFAKPAAKKAAAPKAAAPKKTAAAKSAAAKKAAAPKAAAKKTTAAKKT